MSFIEIFFKLFSSIGQGLSVPPTKSGWPQSSQASARESCIVLTLLTLMVTYQKDLISSNLKLCIGRGVYMPTTMMLSIFLQSSPMMTRPC